MHEDNKERLARVEQFMSYMATTMERIERKLDSHMAHVEEKFLPRKEHDETIHRIEDRIKDIELDLRELEQKTGKTPAWAAALITFLITLVGVVLTAYFRY